MTQFKNRAYGFVSVKAINSNYNADFSGAPRTAPNGQVYANSATLKYAIRHFLNDFGHQVFVFKRYNSNYNPYTLAESYDKFFNTEVKNNTKDEIITKLLSAIDVRLFGATFSPKGTSIKDKNVSIYGAVQINDGLNCWGEGNIFTDQIMSPYRNPGDEKKKENKEGSASTLGRKQKLEEGHYIHHFSINPKNIEDIASRSEKDTQMLSQNDINLLKEALRKGVTYYDSAAKAGCENEILFFVQLNENSRLVLPNFTEMVKMSNSKEEGKRYFDLSDIAIELAKHKSEIAACEIYFNPQTTDIDNLPANCAVNQL